MKTLTIVRDLLTFVRARGARCLAISVALLIIVCTTSACNTGTKPEGTRLGVAHQALGATHVLSGTVYGGGTAMVGALVDALTNGTTTIVASSTANAAGSYALALADGTYDLRVTPPAGSAFSQQSVQDIIISGADLRDDIVLVARGAGVTGQVRGYGGVGVAGATVYALDPVSGVTAASTVTDAQGQYQLGLVAGSYTFVATGNSLVTVPNGYWYRVLRTVSVSSGSVLNFDLPVARVQGLVTDSNGAPVPNVTVNVNGNSSDPDTYDSGQASAQTGADGRYQLLVFTGANTFTLSPPAASGFSTTVLSNVSVSGDFAQTIVLQAPDLSPPVIVSGPLVIHLSDTSVSINWQTNEPANSHADYGVDALTQSISRVIFVTSHEVTLVNLLPSTLYQYTVSSTDPTGNGPSTSALLTFRTQDPPGDITPPIITAGPAVISVAQDSAVVTWTTDEPATTRVHFGLTAALGTLTEVSGEFSRDHQIALTGLSPATKYFFQVESSDPDGNGPTVSQSGSFTTASVPDTQAPVIINGPTVVSATDTTLTVTWTSDEPATSGVSYNDGRAFFVVSDSALVTQHQMTLVRLTAATTYEITVSSSDSFGNGPTLGGPVPGVTLPTPDTTPPTLTGVVVTEISQTSAHVTWNTDELATGQIAFGNSPGNPDGLEGSSTPTTSHDIPLSGLLPGMTYYFTARSVDVVGNGAQSPESSFVTLSVDSDGDGVPDDRDVCPGYDDKLDSDHDGVPDGCDRCPLDASKAVAGICGCGKPDTDTDADGIADCVDPCPNDKTNTCNSLPADADRDGVPDSSDKCPGTSHGQVVDKNGCSFAQLCPCAGPAGTKKSWKNHGDYVECIEDAADAFLRARLINQSQRSSLIKDASTTSCGRSGDHHDDRDADCGRDGDHH